MASVSQPSLRPPFEPSRPSSSNSTTSLRPNLQLNIQPPATDRHPSSTSANSAPWSPSAHSHQGDFVTSPTRQTEHERQSGNPFSTPDRADPDQPAKHSSTRGKQTRPVPSEIFYQLDQIKKLHGEIAREHAKLEKIGGGVELDREGDKEGQSGKEGGKSAKDGDKGGKGKGEAYEKMADEFEQRKDGVQHVMAKLSLLSESLKRFHSLPSPVLFPSHSHQTKTHNTISNLAESTQSPPTTPETQPGPRALRNRIQSHDR